jgi:tetratricopeptide (TPR) repeat protein
MDSKIIAEITPVGSQVTYTTRYGEAGSGVLERIGLDFVVVRVHDLPCLMRIDALDIWSPTEGNGIQKNQILSPQNSEEYLQRELTNDTIEMPLLEPLSPTIDTIETPLLEPPSPLPVAEWQKLEESILQKPESSDRDVTMQGLLESNEITGDAYRRLIEIEALYDTQSHNAVLKVTPPDFKLPQEGVPERVRERVLRIWNSARDKYEYALKVNELSASYGRVGVIWQALEELVDICPSSSAIQRHRAFFLLQARPNDKDRILKSFAQVADNTKQPIDWHNLACMAINAGEINLAGYCLEMQLKQVLLSDHLASWYVYTGVLNLTKRFGNLYFFVHGDQKLSAKDQRVVLEAVIYLLTKFGNYRKAAELAKNINQSAETPPADFYKLANLFKEIPKNWGDFETLFDSQLKKNDSPEITSKFSRGTIYRFFPDRDYGFLTGPHRRDYFFNQNAVLDSTLRQQLGNFVLGDRIDVVFEPVMTSDKKPIAVGIRRFRTIDEIYKLIYKLGCEFVDSTDYAQAVEQMRYVVEQAADYKDARELLEKWEKWQSTAAAPYIPKGSNTYSKAKRADVVERNPDKAINLLRRAIKENDNVESAIKDLSNILASRGKLDEAIDYLVQSRKSMKSVTAVDNLLITFYSRANQPAKAIQLLLPKLAAEKKKTKRASLMWQLSTCYFRLQDYDRTIDYLRQVLSIQPENLTAMKSLAAAFSKQGKYADAESLLRKVLDRSNDVESEKLLKAIRTARETGSDVSIDIENLIAINLSAFIGELSEFAQFFLDGCNFEGVATDRVQSQNFSWEDIRVLENLASRLGTRRPSERAQYFLSAAKIISILDEQSDSSTEFYKFLGRSFASLGDAILSADPKRIDTARDLYCEALSAFDNDYNTRDEQDAANALTRYLLATLGPANVPLGPIEVTIDQTLDKVMNVGQEMRRTVFDAISYLVYHSRYAGTRILNRLHQKSTWRALALTYLNERGLDIKPRDQALDFIRYWNELRVQYLEVERQRSDEIQFLRGTEWTTAGIEVAIERTVKISEQLYFDLDRQRLRELKNLYSLILDMLRQNSFEEQERISLQLDRRIEDLHGSIIETPTRFAVGEIIPLVETLKDKAALEQIALYDRTLPEISIRLANEYYYPDEYFHEITLQVEVTNSRGRSPVESLNLVVKEDSQWFVAKNQSATSEESLRGGDLKTLEFELILTDDALNSKAFSLSIFGSYKVRTGETRAIPQENFTVRVSPESDFSVIPNPYAPYAIGGPVNDPQMFFGRDELITNITQAILGSRSQGKSVVIYGQKRAGKTSVMIRLKEELQKNQDILIIDIRNIASLINERAKVEFLDQILYGIVRELGVSIEEKEKKGSSSLGFAVPDSLSFFQHPDCLSYFQEIFSDYRRRIQQHDDWNGVRIVLMMDEFSYIYDCIVKNYIPEMFMKTWKALLQENLFSAVLASQDVFAKFKARFPNELGTSEDFRVNYLEKDDARDLIDLPIRIEGPSGKSRFLERALDRILEMTAGSPFYIQIMCDRLVEYLNRKRAPFATLNDVERVVKQELIRGNNPLDLGKFDNLLTSGDTSPEAISSEDAKVVLQVIARNSTTGACHRDSIVCAPSKPTDLILQDLVNRDVIIRDRDFYVIRVGLFKEWLLVNE